MESRVEKWRRWVVESRVEKWRRWVVESRVEKWWVVENGVGSGEWGG